MPSQGTVEISIRKSEPSSPLSLTANGAVYWHGANGTLKDCSFINNHADAGGAVCWDIGATNGFLSACSFVNNHANDYGGAVYWYSDNDTLKDCSFVNNHADGYGGAVFWWGDNGKVEENMFL